MLRVIHSMSYMCDEYTMYCVYSAWVITIVCFFSRFLTKTLVSLHTGCDGFTVSWMFSSCEVCLRITSSRLNKLSSFFPRVCFVFCRFWHSHICGHKFWGIQLAFWSQNILKCLWIDMLKPIDDKYIQVQCTVCIAFGAMMYIVYYTSTLKENWNKKWM